LKRSQKNITDKEKRRGLFTKIGYIIFFVFML